MSSNRALYISHGGGPLPLLGDDAHRQLVDTLHRIAHTFTRPSAIVVISAHWERVLPTITAAAHPALIYDYAGFPEQSYDIQYPAPGHPQLAEKIAELLRHSGMTATLDTQRGFDHGLFVPLKIMYPEGNIPCVQLSLLDTLDPDKHLQLGKALRGLEDDNVLVLGSGFSFHNLNAFFTQATPQQQLLNESFEQWLMETCTGTDIPEHDRERRLIEWDAAPGARYCHPREEHLLPLHVCYGFARAPAQQAFTFQVMEKQASAYLWQPAG